MKSRRTAIIVALAALIAALLPLGLMTGGVPLSIGRVLGAFGGENGDTLARFIVIENRLPALITAMLAGASLAVAGLLMQTCFNNPLAGPSIMGISSGASVGVAVVVMALGSVAGMWGKAAMVGGAMCGAALVLVVLTVMSSIVRSADVLLIIGILIGYLGSSVITLLNFFATESAVHSFVVWGLGSFTATGTDSLGLLAVLSSALIAASFFYGKSLNALLFGERYAHSVGIATGRVRTGLLLLSGGLTAVVTAWCGPIGFLGLVVPHMARMLMRTSNHHILLPVSALCGALIALLCQIVSVCPALSKGATIPINAITPFIGVPVIVYVLLKRKKLLYFN